MVFPCITSTIGLCFKSRLVVQLIAKVTFQKDLFEIDALFDAEWSHTETDPLEKEIAALLAQSRF